MEFKITKENTIPNVIYYNYKKAIFYKNQYEKNLKNGGYIKMPYASKEPNIRSTILDTGYIANQLSIGKKIHKIENVDFDGELIIKHVPLTNTEKPLYICFLLKTVHNINTPIDDIIAGKKDNELNLNYLIDSSMAIHYDQCIIFTTPILVKTAFDEFEPVNIINAYSDNYHILYVEPNLGTDSSIIEGATSGTMDTKAIAAYCSPIDENDPSIGENANTLLAIGGDESRLKNEATVSSINMSMNFVVFYALAIFTTFAVPIMYANGILYLVLWNIHLKTPQEKLNRLYMVDIFLSLFLFGLSFSFMNVGIVSTNSYYTLLGFYIFIFFIASFIRIQYDRTFYLDDFYTEISKEPEWNKIEQTNLMVELEGKTPNYEDVKTDIIGFIISNFGYKQEYNKKEKKCQSSVLSVISKIVSIFLIFIFVYMIFTNVLGMKEETGSSILFFIFLLSVYLANVATVAIEMVTVKYTPAIKSELKYCPEPAAPAAEEAPAEAPAAEAPAAEAPAEAPAAAPAEAAEAAETKKGSAISNLTGALANPTSLFPSLFGKKKAASV